MTDTPQRREYGKFVQEEFSADLIQQDPILQYFAYDHLPDHLQKVSKPFATLALLIVQTIPRNAERTVALRKLIESKDAAVRAALPQNTRQKTIDDPTNT